MNRQILKTLQRILCLLLVCLSQVVPAQNEAAKWYFGAGAGLDFMSNPPQILTNSAMGQANYGCASVADANGNLLFYTDGSTILNSAHAPMANGTGLNGWQNSTQPVLIVKKPLSATEYYVFTNSWNGLQTTNGLYYNIVDMSLASGQGSVTVKNFPLYTNNSNYYNGKLTGTKHCNGVDYWIVIREQITNNQNGDFKSFLLASSGVNTTAVTSPANSFTTCNVNYNQWGAIKISPNGQKLGVASYNNNFNCLQNGYGGFELWDFNNSTGSVTAGIQLGSVFSNTVNFWGGWGVEFSPDGTKLYGTRINNYSYNASSVLQWNLCAGSPTAIAASEQTIAVLSNTTQNNGHGGIQLAPNGKIYIAHYFNVNNPQAITVINNPNALGSACNYSYLAQSISPHNSTYSLPNFIGSIFVQPPPVPPFTHTVGNQFGCQGVAFTSPAIPGQTVTGCAAVGYSLTNLVWDFGDPASGSSNTSTATNPIHAFTSLGTYTVKLKYFYSCGGGMDSSLQVVNVNQPCIAVTSNSITCASLGSATVVSTGGIGPFSFTWMPSNQTSSVATGLSPGTYTLTVFDFGNNFTYTATTHFTSLIPLTGNIAHVSSVSCNGAATGTGNVTNLAGGSGNEHYSWYNGVSTLTTANVSALSAGIWTLLVTDALTGCKISEVFLVTQPQALSMNLSSNSPTACAGRSITLSGVVGGGTPGYTYSWTAGPASDTNVVSRLVAGPYSFVMNAYDNLGCHIKDTITVDFIPNPVLSVSSMSICPLETGTLQVSGASSYVWFNNSTGSTFADSPQSTTSYSVVGSALGCTTGISASIVLKPVPNPLFNSTSPRCNGDVLHLYGLGGLSFVWSGPQGFFSSQQYPVLSQVSPGKSGVYSFTVTAANSCTASASGSVVVHPSPTLSAVGSTVCITHSLQLGASSEPGASFLWTGPAAFTSTLQNPTVASPSLFMTGNYQVKAVSVNGCTSAAVAHASVSAVPVPSFVTNSPVCDGEALQFNASATTGAEFFSWSGPSGYNSNQANPLISAADLNNAGEYKLTVTSGPCAASVSRMVTVNPLPFPAITSPDEVCETKLLDLTVHSTGNHIISYLWVMPHASAAAQAVQIATTSALHTGIYSVTVTDINGCRQSAYKQITILANPDVAAAGDTVCLGEPAFLRASGAADYYWLGSNLENYNGSRAKVKQALNPEPEPYLVIGTAANGCTSTASAEIHTDKLPKPVISFFPDDTLCTFSTLRLKGAGGHSYEWKIPGGGYYRGKEVEIITGPAHSSGDYSLTVTGVGGCSNATTAVVHLLEAPGGQLTAGRWQGCSPFCTDFSFVPQTNVNARWTIQKETTTDNSFSGCFTRPGTYTVGGVFTNSLTGCKATQVYTITAFEKPVADFRWEPAEPVEGLDEVELTSASQGTGQNGWNWHVEGTTADFETKDLRYTFPQAGNYRVVHIVYNDRACADTVVKVLSVRADHHVFVPDAFSPDGDGLNDLFIPVVNAAVKYQLEIFDRWGERLFLSYTPGEGWDGTFRGKPCQQAAYVWRLLVSEEMGEPNERQGHVVLLR